jgi:uncharacterized phage protein gp47/JayE
VLLACAEAQAGVALWEQGLVVTLLALTRAASCSGSDLDSWFADFGFARLAGAPSGGPVVFSRFTATQPVIVPVGTVIETADNIQFAVGVDTTNSAYSASVVAGGGYLLAAGAGSITMPVQALVAGIAGNVAANAISVITGAVPGVDAVTNPAPFANGMDSETDAAARARFVLWIAGLSKATKTAIASAIANVQQGLTYTNTEFQDYNGNAKPAYFFDVVDDGSGSPPSSLLASVSAAIDQTRACGVAFGLFSPFVVNADVAMTLTTAAGATHATVVGQVVAALQSAINALPLGASLPFTQLAAIAYGVSGVVNVTGVTLCGGTADLAASPTQVIKARNLMVS